MSVNRQDSNIIVKSIDQNPKICESMVQSRFHSMIQSSPESRYCRDPYYAVFWVLSLGFTSFQGLICCLYIVILLSAAAVNGNCYSYVLYPGVGQVAVMLGPAESAMPWVYCYLPMRLK